MSLENSILAIMQDTILEQESCELSSILVMLVQMLVFIVFI